MNHGKDLFYLLLCLIPFLVNKKKIALRFFEITLKRLTKLNTALQFFKYKNKL